MYLVQHALFDSFVIVEFSITVDLKDWNVAHYVLVAETPIILRLTFTGPT